MSNHNRPLINGLVYLLLVALAAAAPLALYEIILSEYSLEVRRSFAFGIFCCHCNLAVAWIVFGNQQPWTRILVGLLAMLGITIVRLVPEVMQVHFVDSRGYLLTISLMVSESAYKFALTSGVTGIISFLFTQAITLLSLIGIVHIAGKQIHRMNKVPRNAPAVTEEEWQFSIRWMMAVTTGVAIIVAIGRAVLPNSGWEGAFNLLSFKVAQKMLFSNFITALPALAILLAAVSPRRTSSIFLTAAIVAAIACCVRIIATDASSNANLGLHWQTLVTTDISHAISFAMSLFVLRQAGWLRVSQQFRIAQEKTALSAGTR